jgi:hypothetical protein
MFTESLFGAVMGGALRIAPEVLHYLAGRSEREHELKMQKLELQFMKHAPQNGSGVVPFFPESAIEAMREAALQSQTERAARKYPFVDVLTALVRPTVTWGLLSLYAVIRIVTLLSGSSTYNGADMSLLSSVLAFWFMNRVFEKPR